MNQPRVRRWGGLCVDGFPFILPALALVMIFSGLGFLGPAVLFFVLFVFIAWFFRDPERSVPSETGAIVSPADGKVIGVSTVPYPRMLVGQATRVSIFMSVFNVHVNRIPFGGIVRDVAHNPGKFFAAYADKASEQNEQATTLIDTDRGIPILVVQIAGLIARRIACRVSPGERVTTGERYGLIRFGSRCDLYLPPSADVRVKSGDCVAGGKTVLGVFR
ncbi:MAG: phosphatidylserine decarboxylase family protein [Pseudomonadota bacterium]